MWQSYPCLELLPNQAAGFTECGIWKWCAHVTDTALWCNVLSSSHKLLEKRSHQKMAEQAQRPIQPTFWGST